MFQKCIQIKKNLPNPHKQLLIWGLLHSPSMHFSPQSDKSIEEHSALEYYLFHLYSTFLPRKETQGVERNPRNISLVLVCFSDSQTTQLCTCSINVHPIKKNQPIIKMHILYILIILLYLIQISSMAFIFLCCHVLCFVHLGSKQHDFSSSTSAFFGLNSAPSSSKALHHLFLSMKLNWSFFLRQIFPCGPSPACVQMGREIQFGEGIFFLTPSLLSQPGSEVVLRFSVVISLQWCLCSLGDLRSMFYPFPSSSAPWFLKGLTFAGPISFFFSFPFPPLYRRLVLTQLTKKWKSFT